MDFSESLSEFTKDQNINDSEGAGMLDNFQKEEQEAIDLKEEDKFNTAYQASDMGVSGPSNEDYDYQSEFQSGNNFSSDDNGGVNLSNSGIKPATTSVADRDVTTGEPIFGDIPDDEGYIQDGMSELQGSSVNTKTGSPPQDMGSLAKIAYGMQKNGSDYDDFVRNTQGSWSDQQRAVAWNAMERTDLDLQDMKDYGARNLRENADVVYSRSADIAEDIEESDLAANEMWIGSGRNIVEYFNPEGSAAMTDEDVNKSNLATMSMFNWNIPMMTFMVNEVVQSGDQNLAKSFLHMIDQYDATQVSAASVGRAIGAVGGDILTYVTVGGSVLVGRMAAASMKYGAKKALSKIASVAAFDATTEGTSSTMFNMNRQKVEIASGEREELDTGTMAAAGAVGAGLAAGLGVGVATIADPMLRKYGTDAMRKGYNAIRPSSAGKKPPVSASQFVPRPVTFQSEMGREIVAMKGDDISVKKFKNKLNTWIGEGTISKEEVDWSGLNLLENGKRVTKQDLMDVLNTNRPVPTLSNVVEVKFRDNSLLADDTENYRELIINVDRTGYYPGQQDHLGSTGVTQGDQANVGHVRLSDSAFGGQKGTMFLEGQSDIIKSAPEDTLVYSESAKAVRGAELDKNVAKVNGNLVKAIKARDELQEKMMDKHGTLENMPQVDRIKLGNANRTIDSYEARIYEMQENVVDKPMELTPGEEMYTPPFTPFRSRKSNNDLLFRSAMMDAMNTESTYLSWPRDAGQVAKIQKWDASNPQEYPEAIVNFYTKDLEKIAKSYGFKVEEFVPDEFGPGAIPDTVYRINTPGPDMPQDYLIFSTEAEGEAFLDNLMYLDNNNPNVQNRTETPLSTQAERLYRPNLYSEFRLGLPEELGGGIKNFPTKAEMDEYIEELRGLDDTNPLTADGTNTPLADQVRVVPPPPPMNNKFFRAKISPEMRQKWGEEGAGMYSFGAPGSLGKTKSKSRKVEAGRQKRAQKRGEDGRFR